MLLDDFFQIALPCILVFFGNEWQTLLTVEDVPGEWLEVKMPEEGFVLGVVGFHKFNIYLQILFSNCFLYFFYQLVQNILLI